MDGKFRLKRKTLFIFILSIVFINNAYSLDEYFFNPTPLTGSVFITGDPGIKTLSEKVIFSNNIFTTIYTFENTKTSKRSVIFKQPIIDYFNHSFQSYLLKYGLSELLPNEIDEIKLEIVSNSFRFKSSFNGDEREVFLSAGEEDTYQYIYSIEAEISALDKVIITNTYIQYPNNTIDFPGVETNAVEFFPSYKSDANETELIFYISKRKRASQTIGHFYYEAPNKELLKFFISSQPKATEITEDNNYFIYKWKYLKKPDFKTIKVTWGYELFIIDKKLMTIMTNSIYSGDLAAFQNLYPEFIEEMQRKDNLYSLVTALASSLQLVERYNIDARFLINSILALNGYRFSEEEWLNFYEIFDWYEPLTDDPELSEFDRQLIDSVTAFEEGGGVYSAESKKTAFSPTGALALLIYIAGLLLLIGTILHVRRFRRRLFRNNDLFPLAKKEFIRKSRRFLISKDKSDKE